MIALLAIPVLGEWPTAIDRICIILISVGVYLTSEPLADLAGIKGAATQQQG
jgi:hypothetical protein